MLPIQLLRKKDPALRAALARRPGEIDWAAFDALEAQRHQAQLACEGARARRRQVAEAVGVAKRQKDEEQAERLIAQGAQVAAELVELEAAMARLDETQARWVERLPNAPLPSIPDGQDEAHNRVLLVEGDPGIPAHALDHVQAAAAFGGVDAQRGADLSGSRFSVMEGAVARLHRALIQMMLDLHIDAGYREVYVPYLVRDTALFGTGQLPKFAEDLFRTEDGLYLIPTAEVPVTNLVANKILGMEDLPLAWCSHTPCFRREAGSAGRDVHGLIRQHQFEKVEMVRIEHPENSEQALNDKVLGGALAVMRALELPFRVVELCTGDLGFSSQHTYDIEVWLPSQRAYREISSCSSMGDFQARRMNTRLKDGKQTIFPHTLNGSGLAVGRSLVAVLENHLRADGALHIPERLRPHLGNRSVIEPEARR